MAENSRILAQMRMRARHSFFTRRFMLPVQRFIHFEETAGGPLIFAAVVALIWANTPWAAAYHHLWEAKIAISLPFMDHPVSHSVKEWINDALLPLFFFVIGLEIKREVVRGELSSIKRAALPVIVALGGMVIPALIFVAFNYNDPSAMRGWGIPVATDIAFALAILALAGPHIPYSLKLLLLAFAAVDDIGGVLVIAFFYSEGLHWTAAGIAAGLLAVMFVLKYFRVWYLPIYWILGFFFWFAFLESGVHATIAGVILGLMAPARSPFSREQFAQQAEELGSQFRKAYNRWMLAQGKEAPFPDKPSEAGSHEAHPNGTDATGKSRTELQQMRTDARAEQDAILGQYEELVTAVEAPVDRLAILVNPWVSYAILPLFALANAGVTLSADTLGAAATSTAALGVFLGLVVGKPIGCVGLAWIAVKLNLTHLPRRVTWTQMLGVGLLAGIGFTVSLFIAELAFGGGQGPLEQAKISIFAASVVAGTAGFLFLRFIKPPETAEGEEEPDDEEH